MHLTVHRPSLLAACQIASMVAASKDVKPVLRHLKATVNGKRDDTLTLSATDLEIGIRLNMNGCQIEKKGDCLLPASRFVSILREVVDEQLTIEANGERILIDGQQCEFELPAESPSNFPDIPVLEDAVARHEVQAGVLKKAIRQTIFAVATAEHNKFGATTGLLFDLEDEGGTLVATDGRRLSMTKFAAKSIDGHNTHKQMPVVPPKACQLLDKVLEDGEEVVEVVFKPNEVFFKTEKATIYSRLVEGRFPDYTKVIPSKLHIQIPCKVVDLHAAIRQAAVMADDESKRVTFRFEKTRLTLQARGPSSGSSRVDMKIDYHGEPIEIHFDPKYVLEMLRTRDAGEEFLVELDRGDKPALFRFGADYLYLVVPLAVGK